MKLLPEQSNALEQLKSIHSSNDVFWDEATITPNFAKGILSSKSSASPEKIAQTFLLKNRAMLGFDENFNDNLELSTIENQTDDTKHLIYNQLIDEIPVFEGSVQIHIDSVGQVIAYKDHRIAHLTTSAEPEFAAEEALEEAYKFCQHDSPQADPPQLCWFRISDLNVALAWEIVLYDASSLHHSHYFVDAHNGIVLFKFSGVCQVQFQTHDAHNSEEIPGTLVLQDTTGSTSDDIVRAAHENAEKVRDYFSQTFNRNSYDDKGSTIVSTVHFGNNYNNAFWTSHFEQMVYGDGDGLRFGPLVTALDIVGHELTHAVSSKTARFVYAEQSGALDESFADVFGIFITNDGDIINWEVGEGAYTPFRSGDALRDVSQPTRFGQPDHMDDFLHLAPHELPDPDKNDNGYVHSNSGIPNKAAFLSIAGGVHHQITVSGIGRKKAENIFYLALTTYLGSATRSRWTFKQARYALLNATRQLFGDAGLEYASIKNAWAAVGVGESAAAPGTNTYSTNANLLIPDNDPNGVESTIDVADNAVIKELSVAVKIAHSYIGDVRVVVESPNGEAIPLHNRTGGSHQDIERSYNLDTTPALAAFIGHQSMGHWILRVSDHAKHDIGHLQRWTLNLLTEDVIPISEEQIFSTVMTIPDNQSAGISPELVFNKAGTIVSLEVEIEILHFWISDLTITLVSPSGVEAKLHNRSGADRQNISKTFKLGIDTALNKFFSSEAKGKWQLQIIDHVARDQGQLTNWNMKIVSKM